MGAEISYQAVYSNQETFFFNKLPSRVKLLIFTLLPYQDVVNCMLLNKAYYSYLLSNWKLMRKISVSELDFYNGWQSDKIVQCYITIPRNRLFLTPNRAYAKYAPCRHVLQFFETKYDFRRSVIRFLRDIPGVRNLKKLPYGRYPIHNFPISSIEKGAQQYLDFLLSQVNPQCISLSKRPMAKYDITKLLPILKNSLIKHGNSVSRLNIYKVKINSTILDIINLLGLSYLVIEHCDFDNEMLLSNISNATRIQIDTHPGNTGKMNWNKVTLKCDFVKMLQLFIENWMNGKYPKLTTLSIYMPKEEGKILYNEVVKDKFDLVMCANTPDEANEMIYRRCDGWKLRLMYTCDWQYKYLFRTS